MKLNQMQNSLIYKYVNQILDQYLTIGISSQDLLKYLNRDEANFKLLLNKSIQRCTKNIENCNESDIESVLKDLIRDRVALFNDLSK